ncbi:MAG: undecaprenyldiphospho-muramoylpentapeptide beta-N-acetylglucosaminyltransferase [Oscillospiraceae bacterium]|nr:undecaprenyldiphospho-muramoylpentapeptide beta-N-acetylglucosaminyltransferase [Oscillospiraceae bacterium]
MRVIFAGGGTGGHINPAISIADYAKAHDENFEALFIGTKQGLETRLVPKAGYDIRYIDIEGFDRKNMLKNVSVIKKLITARNDCRRIIREFKPDCVVCTGGYVSGPVAMAAYKEGVNALIHEQNVYPGMTVKGSEKYVKYLALSFDETVKLMKNRSKCVVTGNPIRTEILEADKNKARAELGIDKPFVLIFGGSLGADRINETVVSMLPMIKAGGAFKLLFGTGERNYEKVKAAAKEVGITDADINIEITPYIHNMADVMAAADVVVARSGAITVSEIAALGKPSILIPSPNVVRNHQEQNAREFERQDAAEVITEPELSADVLYSRIIKMLEDKDYLKAMNKNLKKIAKTDALTKLYELMLDMAKKSN